MDTNLYIKCRECGQWSKEEDYEDDNAEVYCEDCGTHGANKCPNTECGELYDIVYSELSKCEERSMTAEEAEKLNASNSLLG